MTVTIYRRKSRWLIAVDGRLGASPETVHVIHVPDTTYTALTVRGWAVFLPMPPDHALYVPHTARDLLTIAEAHSRPDVAITTSIL